MVGTFHELLYISDLLHSVSEVVFLYDSAEFKRILHITHFFVTIFFVVNAKIDIYPLTSKSLDNYLAHPTFFLLPLYILHKNESKNRPGDYGGNST